MKIEHLRETLDKSKLFLGKPECLVEKGKKKGWIDENDVKLVEIYKRKRNIADIRVTCLTVGADRFHFWEVFGEGKLGVCLWFNNDELLDDIKKDKTLNPRKVNYYTPTKLIKNYSIDGLPFAKREQYRDEEEFRVLREYSESFEEQYDGITFSLKSLKKNYFNSWLSPDGYKKEAKIILLKRSFPKYKHVIIFQNKTHKYKKWINAANLVK